MSTVSIIMTRDNVPQRKCGWAWIPEDSFFGGEIATAKALADACGCPRFQSALSSLSLDQYGCEFLLTTGGRSQRLTIEDMRYAWGNRMALANGLMHRPTDGISEWVESL